MFVTLTVIELAGQISAAVSDTPPVPLLTIRLVENHADACLAAPEKALVYVKLANPTPPSTIEDILRL